jgi:hypothetical protein
LGFLSISAVECAQIDLKRLWQGQANPAQRCERLLANLFLRVVQGKIEEDGLGALEEAGRI